MKLLIGLTAVLSVVSASILPRFNTHVTNDGVTWMCPEPTEEFLKMSQQMAVAEKTMATLDDVEVKVWVNIVGTELCNDPRTEDRVRLHMATINEAYHPAQFQFKLLGIVCRYDDELSAIKSSGQVASILDQYRQGDITTLNIFVAKEIDGVAGMCTSYGFDPHVDGCFFPWEDFPQTTADGVPYVDAGAHEIGHWLGLAHTFQEGDYEGNCSAPDNDGIDDTPVHLLTDQVMPDRCGVGKDSCSDRPGLDPMTNYMTYLVEACGREFTPQQIIRMHSWWQKRVEAASNFHN